MPSFNNESPRLTLRQALYEHFADLRSNPAAVTSMLRRDDTLLTSSAEEQLRERARYLRETPIDFRLGYPPGEAALPAVCLIEEANSEADTVMGGLFDSQTRPVGDTYEIVEQVGSNWRQTIQVSCWATQPFASEVIATAIEHAAIFAKGALMAIGCTDVTISRDGMEAPNPQLYPRVAYLPIVRVTLAWERTAERRHFPVAARIFLQPLIARS
jgi:hypothetical protein